MKIKAQMAMVMNLDKCLACHTCSIPCKNAWTTPSGSEYIWFNNVETKPGIGYPKQWENQDLWHGGWKLGEDGKLKLEYDGKWAGIFKLFGNARLPKIEDYYEPWNYNYQYLTSAPAQKCQPAVGPRSAITGEHMNPQWGVNWEDDLAGANVTGLEDINFRGLEARAYLNFKKVFMFHLPRICEHCLHPACVASCPSGALYKRDEDGIVLADQTRCRSWRRCQSACPYKKVYLNWKTHRAEKCIFCYPRIEAGEPTLCAQCCPGRIRYVGVMLYDIDKVREAAATAAPSGLHNAQLSVFLNPNDPEIASRAVQDGVPSQFVEAAQRSPVYKLISEWQIALPLHPEFRTLPMIWYVPPLSPLVNEGIKDPENLDNMRIPIKYLANLLAAGDEEPVRTALRRLMAMRSFMRSQRLQENSANDEGGTKPGSFNDFAVDTWNFRDTPVGEDQEAVLKKVGLTPEQTRAMYRLLALARFEDRFVVPTTHREWAQDVDKLKGDVGFPEAIS